MGRDYPDNGYPSVTGALGVLRKIGLEMWFKYNTAKFCDEESKRGKEIGTQIHDVIHQYITTGKASIQSEYGTEVETALQSFMLFRKENPEYKLELAEMSLTSEKYCFNGTVDCIAGDVILDWKTSTCKEKEKPDIYDEYLFQLAAYVNLYNENKNVDIVNAVSVVIAKDKVAYNIYKMDGKTIFDCFEYGFLPCLQILNQQKRIKTMLKEKKKNVTV